MKYSNSSRRSLLLFVISVMILSSAFSSWIFVRFRHADTQNRILQPQHYKIQVVTGEDYRRLSDPAVRKLTLSDGTTISKAPIWDEVVLPGYKRVARQDYHVLVTTKGTAHVVSYFEHYLLTFSTLAVFGMIASFWNMKKTMEIDYESFMKERSSDGVNSDIHW